MNAKVLREEFDVIKENRIVSIFWITATNERAKRITYLEKEGAITWCKTDKRDAYPNCVFVVDEDRFNDLVRALSI